MSSPAAHNYPRFDRYVESGADERDFAAFPMVVGAGAEAPEIGGVLLDTGEEFALSSVWRRRLVVVEFGSFT